MLSPLQPRPSEAAARAQHEDALVSTLQISGNVPCEVYCEHDRGSCSRCEEQYAGLAVQTAGAWRLGEKVFIEFTLSGVSCCDAGIGRGGAKRMDAKLAEDAAEDCNKAGDRGRRGCSARHRIEASNLVDFSNLLSRTSLDGTKSRCIGISTFLSVLASMRRWMFNPSLHIRFLLFMQDIAESCNSPCIWNTKFDACRRTICQHRANAAMGCCACL